MVGGDVDDVAATARGHDRGDGAPEQVDPPQVRADLVVEVVERLVPRVERRCQSYPCGVRHGDVDAAVVCDDPLDDTVFTLQIPRDAVPITLAELRNSGPLGR